MNKQTCGVTHKILLFYLLEIGTSIFLYYGSFRALGQKVSWDTFWCVGGSLIIIFFLNLCVSHCDHLWVLTRFLSPNSLLNYGLFLYPLIWFWKAIMNFFEVFPEAHFLYQIVFPVTHGSLGAQRTEVMLVKISEKSRHWLAWTLTGQAVGWLVGSGVNGK